MCVREVGEGERESFDDFIARSPWGHLFQSWAWGRLKGAFGWRPTRLVVEDRGRIRAAATVLEHRLPFSSRSILYVPRGPVLDWNDPGAAKALFSGLRTLGRERRAVFLKIDPAVPAAHAGAARALRDAEFTPAGTGAAPAVLARTTWRLDLTRPAAALAAGAAAKTRYKIRHAERRGATTEALDARALPLFYRLYAETSRRQGFPARSPAYFQKAWDALAPSGHLRLYGLRQGGEWAAAALVGCLGTRMWGLALGTSGRHRSISPGYVLLWHIFQQAKALGFESYDLGGNAERPGRLGVAAFKRHLGAERIDLIGEHDLVFHPVWRRVWQVAYGTCTRLGPHVPLPRLLRQRQEAAEPDGREATRTLTNLTKP